ncbi:MAG: HWE histidine kinase domain-containing protein [Geminicoccaceae bacterium]
MTDAAAPGAEAGSSEREGPAFYRSVLDEQIEMISRFRADGTLLFANRAYAASIGRTAAEVEGQSFWPFIPEGDRPGVIALMDRLTPDDPIVTIENRFETAAGPRWVLWSNHALVFDADGRWLEAQSTGVDITARKLVEEELQRERERLRLALGAADLATWDRNLLTGETRWNDKMFRLLGLDPAAVVPSLPLWATRVLPEDLPEIEAALARSLAEGIEYVAEFRVRGEGDRINWVEARGHSERAPDGTPIRSYGVLRDITAQKLHEQRQQLVVAELNHRVRNTLSLVQAIMHQTFRGAAAPPDLLKAFEDRIIALAGAHAVLTRRNWESPGLAELLHEAVAFSGDARARIALDGPPVTLSPDQGIAIVLAVHELGTNALKYGALSQPTGAVALTWTLDAPGRRLDLVWTERGGPPVHPPARRGFGTTMIEHALPRQVRGSATLAFDPAGLRCEIRVPLASAGSRPG